MENDRVSWGNVPPEASIISSVTSGEVEHVRNVQVVAGGDLIPGVEVDVSPPLERIPVRSPRIKSSTLTRIREGTANECSPRIKQQVATPDEPTIGSVSMGELQATYDRESSIEKTAEYYGTSSEVVVRYMDLYGIDHSHTHGYAAMRGRRAVARGLRTQ